MTVRDLLPAATLLSEAKMEWLFFSAQLSDLNKDCQAMKIKRQQNVFLSLEPDFWSSLSYSEEAGANVEMQEVLHENRTGLLL